MGVFVIAEAGSCHENDLQKAFVLIQAAKLCGADACKFQYWSDSKALAERRKLPQAEAVYAKYKLPYAWLPQLRALCLELDIEFMCTTYLPQDIETVEPFVERFKVSAFESTDAEFVRAHSQYGKDVIVSINPTYLPLLRVQRAKHIRLLHCISEYPTPVDRLGLTRIAEYDLDGFSDHSGHEMAGAVAVGCGANIIEAHIRLRETLESNPDHPHSLVADRGKPGEAIPFKRYVENVRLAERML